MNLPNGCNAESMPFGREEGEWCEAIVFKDTNSPFTIKKPRFVHGVLIRRHSVQAFRQQAILSQNPNGRPE